MKVLITGGSGFVGQNLRLHLARRKDVEVVCFARGDDLTDLPRLIQGANFVFHLAGVNRPKDPLEYTAGNVDLTLALCEAAAGVASETGWKAQIVYASSIQAVQGTVYGESKRAAENLLRTMALEYGLTVHLFRLPNVFGKWCKPNYNSAVATFCHNISRGLPIQINDVTAPLTLVYVDDVIGWFLRLLDGGGLDVGADGFITVKPQYTTTVGALALQIEAFKKSRETLITERVGQGLERALYATYVSYLPVEMFSYAVPQYGDPRGVFVEMLKTQDSGQISFFTSRAGATRGGHYHHTKSEKFLVIKGRARFRFRHLQTGQAHEVVTTASAAVIVESVPGWTHDVTNIGDDDLIVMLWANEVFDRARPDTVAGEL